jgi:NTP pyrophosphatase (non-canonical NTP hydrolase)
MHDLKRQIKQFIRERDWEQYHAPKNLAMALSVEVTEILEIFQWKDSGAELSAEEQQALEEEIGDVMIYLIELADQFGIDPVHAAKHKLTLNARKYPADVVRGRADKYTAYSEPEENS